MSTPPEVRLGAAAALAWASRSGLLMALLSGPRSEEQLAAHLECDPRALGLVLGVLEADGWTRREGDRHVLAAPDEHGAIARELWLWQQLDAFAETGRSLIDDEARGDVYPAVVSYLAARFAADARALAEALGPAGAILDVGAGSGVWSLAMAARDERSIVTALDLPRTLEVFRRHAEDAGLGARAEVLAGDFHQVGIPAARFDRVVLANVVHLEARARAEALVARCARAVAPGGQLVVVDAVADPPPELALGVAVYALHLGMRVPGSRVYSRAELEGLSSAAGLTVERWIPLSRGLHALVVRAG